LRHRHVRDRVQRGGAVRVVDTDRDVVDLERLRRGCGPVLHLEIERGSSHPGHAVDGHHLPAWSERYDIRGSGYALLRASQVLAHLELRHPSGAIGANPRREAVHGTGCGGLGDPVGAVVEAELSRAAPPDLEGEAAVESAGDALN